MRNFNKLATCLIIALAMTACNSDDVIETPEVNDGMVKFSSGIENSGLKVGGDDGDEWQGNERIGIYMVAHGTTTIVDNAENANYLYSSLTPTKVATFKSGLSTTTIYYPVDVTKLVDFIAYHPYSATVSDYKYSVDVSDQSNQSGIDLMRAIANNEGDGYNKTQESAYVNLVFDHKLTKIIFYTIAGTGITTAEVRDMTVTMKELGTKATYDIDKNELSAASDKKPITTYNGSYSPYYEAIVVPQSVSDGEVIVIFKLNSTDEEFEYAMPATVFAAGEKHVFNVTVNRTGVSVRATITPWEPVGEVDGIAK